MRIRYILPWFVLYFPLPILYRTEIKSRVKNLVFNVSLSRYEDWINRRFFGSKNSTQFITRSKFCSFLTFLRRMIFVKVQRFWIKPDISTYTSIKYPSKIRHFSRNIHPWFLSKNKLYHAYIATATTNFLPSQPKIYITGPLLRDNCYQIKAFAWKIIGSIYSGWSAIRLSVITIMYFCMHALSFQLFKSPTKSCI